MQTELNKFAKESGNVIKDKLAEVFTNTVKLIIIALTFLSFLTIFTFISIVYLILNKEPNTVTKTIIKKEIVYKDKYNENDYIIIPKNDLELIKTKKINNKKLFYYKYNGKNRYYYITYYKK